MNIDVNNINPSRSDGPKKATPNKGAELAATNQSTNNTQAASPKDSVSLSSSAQNLTKIELELKSLPEVNQSRVDEVKARIDRGEYQPDSANLAQKMLELG